jgi:hypothetical protein
MDIGRIFIVFAALTGLAAGAILVWVPQSRDIGLAPYFWVLIAFALFEGAVFARRGAAGGPPISMLTRIAGFALALVLMFMIPQAAGVPIKLF